MDMKKCATIPLNMFKTYVSTIQGSTEMFFIDKTISMNARKMSGNI